jgi:uncharacterized protein (DUF433 family)
MDYKEYIESNSSILLGKPVLKGTRITVEFILQRLSEGTTNQKLIEGYPSLTNEMILAALSYASDVISNETILEVA